MATEVQGHSDQSLTALVGGIVNDVQGLLKQQMQLTRKEIQADLRKAQESATLLAFGIGTCFLSAMSFCLMLALLLYWLGAPHGSEMATIPLWGCFGLVGGFLAVVGAAVAYAGKRRFDTLHPLERTAQALEENLEWKTTANNK